ncbi:MAG: M20 family metallopeptidase [Lentisphaerae bacterium]|nr:M20 family metallopeptidase [Lentisphaerota bacterium]
MEFFMDTKKIFEALKSEVELISSELEALAVDLWEHPELAWKEFYAAETLCKFLKKHDIDAQANYLDFPTAFRGDIVNGDGAVFALTAEYDALPPGHACGHNLIAAASVGAAIAAARVMKKLDLPGTLVIMGTPAEESGGGKVKMLQKGALNGIDAVMMSHPSWRTIPDPGSLAIRRWDVTFHGVSSHAGGTPELGINALDAVMMLFNGVSFQRQQMPDFCRIHGIVTHGGKMPNIIPDTASCRFYLRSATEEWMEKLDERFDNMVKGAALLTGCTYTKEKFSIDCRSRKPNALLNSSYCEVMAELGENIPANVPEGRGSSDFGDFSQAVPGAHPCFAISPGKIGGHSIEFQEASRSELGLKNMLKSAIALACTACRFLDDESFRNAVKADFAG